MLIEACGLQIDLKDEEDCDCLCCLGPENVQGLIQLELVKYMLGSNGSDYRNLNTKQRNLFRA